MAKTLETGRQKALFTKTLETGRKRTSGTKTDRVLKHLQQIGPITTWDAILLYRATRLSGLIYQLREQGYNIVGIKKKNKEGRGYHAEYHLLD